MQKLYSYNSAKHNIYNIYITNLLKNKFKIYRGKILGKYQNRFRPGKSTVNNPDNSLCRYLKDSSKHKKNTNKSNRRNNQKSNKGRIQDQMKYLILNNGVTDTNTHLKTEKE